ncbi:T9SS C-terminal target domain-containing protein, partial [candidate division KSB1 bacterium]
GVMAEFYAFPGNANWLFGEDCIPSSSQYNCLRNLIDPHHPQSMTSDYPSKMSEYADWPIDQDNGGVHRNSTIPGHAYYLMSTKMAREKVEKIIYRAFKTYLTRRSQFVDCRIAAIQAAKDLYAGEGMDALVAQAFNEVEVYGDEETEPDAPYEPVDGDDYVLALLNESNEVIRIESDMPYQDGAAVSLGFSSSSKPSVTEDGSIIAYIDLNGNVNLYDTVEEENYPVTDDGQWYNIAISPKADYVAVTPDPEIMPSVIGLIDMNSEDSQLRNLYVPTTSEGAETIPEYADILDWSIEGGWLIYDCLFSVQDEYGNASDTWGIYLTNATSEAVIPLFQPSAELAVGNPSFSSTRDNVIAFDVAEYSASSDYPTYSIHTYDLFSGELGLIQQDRNTFGHPSFSPNDQRIVFQDISDEDVSYLLQAAMQADLLNANASTIQAWVQPVGYPVWYAIGTRPGGDDFMVEESFDGDDFPPAGWTVNHLSGAAESGWRSGNAQDHNFSAINPENAYSAICGYDENDNQIDRLFSPAFDIAGSPSLTFWAGYNSYWTTNYEVKVYITKSGSADPDVVIWQQKVEGDDGTEGWEWREFDVDLAPYGGRQNVRLCWEYSGRDGDLFALDDILFFTDATAVERPENPQTFSLLTNFPNPFNGTTIFSYSITAAGPVKIEIYNMNGRLIKTLVDDYHSAGYYTKKWDADVSSGLYVYRMLSPAGQHFGKTLLLK